MKNKRPGNPDYQTKPIERLAYPLYGMGQSITYTFITGYLMLFYTDSLFIAPFVVSIIMLLSKVWDAVNDPLFGIIVDRMSFKSGKFKPWLRWASILIPVSTVLVFLVPSSLPMGWRIAFAVIAYVLWDFSYTLSDVPLLSMLTAMTGNLNERTRILSLNGVFGVVPGLLVNVVVVPRLEEWGFPIAAGIVSVVSILGMFLFPFVANERNRESVVSEERYKLRDIWEYVSHNKYLLYFYAFACIFGMFNVPLSTYVIKHCLGSLDYVGTYTIIAFPLLIAAYLLVPVITKKVDRMRLFKIVVFVLIALSIGMYLGGYSSPVIYGIFWIARNVAAIAGALLIFTFATDFVEYGNYITGMRKEGITFAVQTFATKFMGATATALAALALGIIGYDGEAVTHSAQTLNLLFAASNLLPVAGILLGLPLLFKCNFKSSDIQIMANINNGSISREEGNVMLSRKYD